MAFIWGTKTSTMFSKRPRPGPETGTSYSTLAVTSAGPSSPSRKRIDETPPEPTASRSAGARLERGALDDERKPDACKEHAGSEDELGVRGRECGFPAPGASLCLRQRREQGTKRLPCHGGRVHGCVVSFRFDRFSTTQ